VNTGRRAASFQSQFGNIRAMFAVGCIQREQDSLRSLSTSCSQDWLWRNLIYLLADARAITFDIIRLQAGEEASFNLANYLAAGAEEHSEHSGNCRKGQLGIRQLLDEDAGGAVVIAAGTRNFNSGNGYESAPLFDSLNLHLGPDRSMRGDSLSDGPEHFEVGTRFVDGDESLSRSVIVDTFSLSHVLPFKKMGLICCNLGRALNQC